MNRAGVRFGGVSASAFLLALVLPWISSAGLAAHAQIDAPEASTVPEVVASGPSETADDEPDDPPREPHAWETPVRDAPVQAVSFHPFALMSPGLSVAYERALPRRFSILGRAAFWAPIGGDYRSRNLGLSAEARWYVLGRGPFTRFHTEAIVGPYLGLRVGVTQTVLVDHRNDRRVGTAQRFALEGSFGFRMAIRGRVEITPYVGALFYSDFLAGMATTMRPSLSWGFSIGALLGRRGQDASAEPASEPDAR